MSMFMSKSMDIGFIGGNTVLSRVAQINSNDVRLREAIL
jgi:hypothetical protein